MFKTRIDRLFGYMHPFAAVVLCALCAMLLMRLAELGLLFTMEKFAVPRVVGRGLLSMLMCLGAATALLLPLYALLAWWRQRLATAVSAALFGLLIFAEAGLTSIALRRGLPIGSELIMRPSHEVLHTLSSAMPVWLAVGLCVGAVGAFTGVSLWATRLRLPRGLTAAALVLVLMAAPFAPKAGKLTSNITKPKVANYIENKTLFLVRSCLHMSRVKEHSYGHDFVLNHNMLERFLRDNPGLQPLDSLYPLERPSSTIPDVLSGFFAPLPDGQLPNVVVVVAESLGREWSGDNELGVSFTPFFDSLARHGLYWPNCLSTSTRSFGAVPSITGSVPPGPRGFQFGIMPQHNSLISLLRSNGYRANAFYASDFEFDGIYEYLLAQQVDYFSSTFKKEALGCGEPDKLCSYWGYHDEYLFQRSLQELERIDSSKSPLFNLFITISAHDELNLNNASEQAHYMHLTQSLIDQLPDGKRGEAQRHLKGKAALLYSDHALRQLFRRYSQRPDFERTIFVITGDHSLGLQVCNRLGFHHVPLLIWSPLLTRSAQHQPLVTHLDIAPSLAALLHGRYGMPLPATAQWASNGLGTGTRFEAKRRMLLLDYDHEITKMIYDNYMFLSDIDEVYAITPTLDMLPVHDASIKDTLRGKLLLYKYINNYIYTTDHLTQHPLVEREHFELLTYRSIDAFTGHALPQPPSQMQPKEYILLKMPVSTNGFSKLRVQLMGKLMVEGDVCGHHQMTLKMGCYGGNMQHVEYYGYITKYLKDDDLKSDEWYNLHIIRDFNVNNSENVEFYLVLSNVTDDTNWVEDNTLHFNDIYITLEGSR